MTTDEPRDLRPGTVVQGEVFPEPVRVVAVRRIGEALQVGGQGVRTRMYHERLLTPEQAAALRITPAEPPLAPAPGAGSRPPGPGL